MTQLTQERLLLGITAAAATETAVRETVSYAKVQKAFRRAVFDCRDSKFVLAKAATTAHIARVFLASCIDRHLDGEFDPAAAAMAEWWLTERQVHRIDQCLKLHGGYG